MALDGQKLNFVGRVRQPMIDVAVGGWLVQEVVEEVVDVGCGGGDGKKPCRFVLFLCGDVMFWLVGVCLM